jgi:hypothetical protein
MAARDLLRGVAYKSAKNRVVAIVGCNKLLSNLSKLAASKNLPTVLWEIANAAIGKPRQPLPDLVKNSVRRPTAVNEFYVDKVRKICASIAASLTSGLPLPGATLPAARTPLPDSNGAPPRNSSGAILRPLASQGEPGEGHRQ